MGDTSLLAIKKKDDAPGYVYLIRFNHSKDCYKIGSTGNLFKRMEAFGDQWNDVDLIAYGYASDRLLIEREIQYLLSDYNNNQRYYRMWPKVINYQFRGRSEEHTSELQSLS